MAEEAVPPSEASSAPSGSSFRNFWNLKDKIPGKTIKFMPNVTKPGDGQDKESDTAALTQKQHRRAQVRKAQKEHRQRKQNQIKFLEQEVIRLREMIAAVEAEGVLLGAENVAIKDTLSKENILDLPSTSLNRLSTNFIPPPGSPGFLSPQNWPLSSNSSDRSASIPVSIEFDQLLDASCLHIDRSDSFGDAYNRPLEIHPPPNTTAPDVSIFANITVPLTLPPQPSPSPTFRPMTPSQSDMAVNFILALEHPCHTHFNHTPPANTPFDPNGEATGHELMASTLLYSHAPSSVFPDATKPPTHTNHPDPQPPPTVTWTTPNNCLTLAKLHAMSLSLPKGDFEITPVQAWFLLATEYDVVWLLQESRLEVLKRELGQLVKCWAFGAVIDDGVFWAVVRGCLGEGKGTGVVRDI